MSRALVLILLLASASFAGVEFDGSSHYTVLGATDTSPPLTVSCKVRASTNAANMTAVGLAQSSGDLDYWILAYLGASGDAIRWQASMASGTVVDFAVTSTTISDTAAWHHLCGVEASSADRRVYLDGGGKGTNATLVTPSMPAPRTGIGLTPRTSLDLKWQGAVAQVAIWNVALTDEEVLSLAQGKHPFLVRLGSLIAYYPLDAHNAAGAVDMVSGLHLTTVTGTPTSTDSPPIHRPQPQYSHAPALRSTWRRSPLYRDDEETYGARAA